jgi:hypothetical protein
MRLSTNTKLRAFTALLVCMLLRANPMCAQQGDSGSMQTATQERLETEPWWPTMSTFPLKAFAGSSTCTRCHQDEASINPPTPMQRAASRAADATFLRGKPPVTLTSGPFTYALASTSAGIEYAVSDGPHKLSHPLDWVIGAGVLGRTFLYQMDNHWYQSLATFYTNHSALDITTGLTRAPDPHLTTALGQPLSPDDTRRCFSCHTVHSTTSQGFDPLHAEAGLGCEACHGPGAEHATLMIASAKPTTPNAASASHIFNPAKLSPVDSNDFCGACHRTFADATLSMASAQASSTAVVRFQPYRLEESRCWRETQDARLTCIACHNPHQPLNRNPAAYDKHCLECHTTVAAVPATAHAANAIPARVCPKATSQCVTCHMPRVNVASMHGDFTDHFIRVVHQGEAFPQ